MTYIYTDPHIPYLLAVATHTHVVHVLPNFTVGERIDQIETTPPSPVSKVCFCCARIYHITIAGGIDLDEHLRSQLSVVAQKH